MNSKTLSILSTLILATLLIACGTEATPPSPTPNTGQPTRIAPRPPSSANIGETWLHPIDEMPLVFVPAGVFTMGASSAPDQQPIRSINLPAFWIDQFEVTTRMYDVCVSEGDCTPPDNLTTISRLDYFNNFAYAEYPVVNVTWEQASAYCSWTGRRLPTEAEWEKAARSSNAFTYPWGEEAPTCEDLSFRNTGPGAAKCVKDTTPVGSYPQSASPFGAYDMAGNAQEWVADWYAPDAYLLDYGPNPTGPTIGTERVLRGGSFNNDAEQVTTTSRSSAAPDIISYVIGFRCAISAP